MNADSDKHGAHGVEHRAHRGFLNQEEEPPAFLRVLSVLPRVPCVVPDRRQRCPGYTLLEVLLVFALIALVVGIVWPAFAGGGDELTLEKAANDVLVACRYARNEAVVSGWRHCLRFRETVGDAPVLELVAMSPLDGEADAVAARDHYGRPIAFPEGTEVEILPAADDGLDSDEPAVMHFYPDGTSDGGEIRVLGPRYVYIIQVAGYTGRSEIRRRSAVQAEAEEEAGR